MGDWYKYPRTPHFPWSPGATNDDKVLKDLSCFAGKDVVMTEKMDGECTTMYPDHYHARSLDSNNHPSRNYVKGIWGQIRHEIPAGWRICGENVYARHSIVYEDLDDYFYVFSIWNEENVCLSWAHMNTVCIMLGLKVVPVLYMGPFDLQLVKDYHMKLDLERQEGFVVRSIGEFRFDDFQQNVAKWVRKGHVQTDSHWMSGEVVPNKLRS